ncbi:MAG: hypothetical protein JXR71_04025 [Bacteroidales bacterium]|nr:hypothetical protein [Bacteroidales bacterium]
MDRFALFENVRKTVPGYERFLSEHQLTEVKDWEDIPFCDKQNYLLTYPIRELIRENSFDKCFLIGASSGFSKSGSVLWLKQSEDEAAYIEAVKQLLIDDYSIDKKSTLILVSLALGTWIGGMQLACAFRSLAGKMDGIVTATPGIDLKESVHIAQDFGPLFEQIVWVTNPSSISIIYSLLREEKELLNGKIYFPVVGEYFTENFRISVAKKFGHDPDNVYVAKTGYGSADTGDLGIESRGTILLRKYLNNNPMMSARLFQDENPPMLFEKNEHAYLETVDNHLIVTKDQFVPLIRYNTKDTGGIIQKETLKQAGVPKTVLKELPEELLYVFGRTSDAVVFYGTNLNIYSSGDFLNSLDETYLYGGLYEVQKTEKNAVEFLEFTVFVIEEKEGLAKKYQKALIGFLKTSSNEFNAKYDRLSAAVSEDLVQVKTESISSKNLATKHHTIKS